MGAGSDQVLRRERKRERSIAQLQVRGRHHHMTCCFSQSLAAAAAAKDSSISRKLEAGPDGLINSVGFHAAASRASCQRSTETHTGV